MADRPFQSRRDSDAPMGSQALSWSLIDTIATGALLAAALLSRSFGLGDAALIYDEYYTVWHAHERVTEFFNPAYYILVVLSMQTFGATEWAARLPAMLLGALSIPLFYATWRQVIGRNAAGIGAVLILLSSWHLWFSHFSRFYSGVFLFSLLSFYFYHRALVLDDLRRLAAAIVCAVLAVLFHATAVVVPIVCGLFSLIIWFLGSRATGYSSRVARLHVAVHVIVGLAALTKFVDLADKWSTKVGTRGPMPAALVLQIARDVQPAIGVAALFGALMLLRREPLKGLLVALGIVLPGALLVAGSAVMEIKPHYMFATFPLVIAAAAVLCDEVYRALEFGRGGRLAGFAMFGLIVVGILPSTASHYLDRFTPDIRDAVRVVAAGYRPGDRIYASDKGFNHYAPKGLDIAVEPEWPYLDNVDWKRKLDAELEKPGRLWLVLPMGRRPLAPRLESWLLANARLVWRIEGRRIDYTANGIQVFLATPQAAGATTR